MWSPAFDQRPIGVKWAGGGLIFITLGADSEASDFSLTLTIPSVGTFQVTDDKKTFGKKIVPVTLGLVTKDMLRNLYAWSYKPYVKHYDEGEQIEGSLAKTVVGNLIVLNWGLAKSKSVSKKPEFTIHAQATIEDQGSTSYSGGYAVSDIRAWGTFAPGDGTSNSFDLWFTTGHTNTNVRSTSPAFPFSGACELSEALAIAAAYETTNGFPSGTAVVSAPTTGVEPCVPIVFHRFEQFNYLAQAQAYPKVKAAVVIDDGNGPEFSTDDDYGFSDSSADGNNPNGPDPTAANFTAKFSISTDLETGTVVKS